MPKIRTVTAKVIAKDCELVKHGSRSESRHEIIYWAEFLTNNGKTVKYSIPQELYDSLEKHQKGTLATTDGEFFYFGDGEDITQ